jgi:hypothetical protein
MHRLLHRRADADLDGLAGIDQPLLDGVAKHRAMGKRLAEILGPRVHMGIEMDQRHRPLPGLERAQQGQRDGVIAAEGNEMAVACRLALDQGEACRHVGKRQVEVAAVGEGELQGIAPIGRIGAVRQHAACLANGERAEASTRPVGGAEIEGNTNQAVGRVRGPGPDAEEGGRQGKRRTHLSFPRLRGRQDATDRWRRLPELNRSAP